MGFDKERFLKGLDYVMPYGRNKGKTLKWVCKEDTDYMSFLTSNPEGPKLKVKNEVIMEARKYGLEFM